MPIRILVASAFLVLAVGARAGEVGPPPEYPLLDSLFKESLLPEQRAGLGENASLRDTAATMTAEQRLAVRGRLARAEATAKTPAELKEIVQGYLILDEQTPTAGQAAVRLATQLQEQDPGSSDGHALAAAGLHQMGDYEAAAQEARKALELNPNDKAAWATLKLSEDRVPTAVKLPKKEAPATISSKHGAGPTVDEELPYKLPIKSRPTKAVPGLESEKQQDAPASGRVPLWPLGAAAGLGLTAYGVQRSRGAWSGQENEPPAEETPEQYQARLTGLKHKAKVAAGSVAVVVGGYALYTLAPQFTVPATVAAPVVAQHGPRVIQPMQPYGQQLMDQASKWGAPIAFAAWRLSRTPAPRPPALTRSTTDEETTKPEQDQPQQNPDRTIPAPNIPQLPGNPADSPGEGWQWKGKQPPGSKGAWVRKTPDGNGKESLHPDLKHDQPVGPHWDYTDQWGRKFRKFPDGRIEPK